VYFYRVKIAGITTVLFLLFKCAAIPEHQVYHCAFGKIFAVSQHLPYKVFLTEE